MFGRYDMFSTSFWDNVMSNRNQTSNANVYCLLNHWISKYLLRQCTEAWAMRKWDYTFLIPKLYMHSPYSFAQHTVHSHTFMQTLVLCVGGHCGQCVAKSEVSSGQKQWWAEITGSSLLLLLLLQTTKASWLYKQRECVRQAGPLTIRGERKKIQD